METSSLQALQPNVSSPLPPTSTSTSTSSVSTAVKADGDIKKLDSKEDVAPSPTENLKKIEEEMSKDEQAKLLKEVVDELNREMSPLNFGIKFGFSDEIDSMYVSVYERATDKVIRKIPSDEAIQLMAKMREIVGMIFDKKG